jgi:hypothetical protein
VKNSRMATKTKTRKNIKGNAARLAYAKRQRKKVMKK